MLEALLKEKLGASLVHVEDESARHAGHAGVREKGGGHFRVVVVSTRFEGKTALERHRLVYGAVMENPALPVHALAVKAFTPAEWEARGHKA